MRLYKNWLQKLIALAAMAIAFISFSFAPVKADTATDTSTCSDSTTCLQYITQNTYNILQKVNTLPDFFTTISTYFDNLISSDASDTTSQMIPNFTQVGNAIITANNTATDASNAIQMSALTINSPIADFSSIGGAKPTVLNKVPNINEISYSTMLGLPPVSTNGANTDPTLYLKNAAGLNYPHIQPQDGWQGVATLPKYKAYYNTIMATESFNSFVLNRLMNENTNGSQYNAYQNTLVSQATGSTWLTSIGSEEIGKVIRQILLYQSQSYVLMSQIAQTQKDILTALVLANTLQIQGNQDKESALVTKAQNIKPAG